MTLVGLDTLPSEWVNLSFSSKNRKSSRQSIQQNVQNTIASCVEIHHFSGTDSDTQKRRWTVDKNQRYAQVQNKVKQVCKTARSQNCNGTETEQE